MDDHQFLHFANKTFLNHDSGELITLIAREGHGLFKYDYQIGDFEIILVKNPEDLSSMIAVIDVIKL